MISVNERNTIAAVKRILPAELFFLGGSLYFHGPRGAGLPGTERKFIFLLSLFTHLHPLFDRLDRLCL